MSGSKEGIKPGSDQWHAFRQVDQHGCFHEVIGPDGQEADTFWAAGFATRKVST